MTKHYMNGKGISFPNTTDLLEARKNLKPAIKPLRNFLSNHSNLPGVAVDYIVLVKMTTASVINAINYTSDTTLDPSLMYRIHYKDGADGTGSQTVWKSKSMIGGVPNMYQYSIVPLRMECVK